MSDAIGYLSERARGEEMCTFKMGSVLAAVRFLHGWKTCLSGLLRGVFLLSCGILVEQGCAGVYFWERDWSGGDGNWMAGWELNAGRRRGAVDGRRVEL